LAQGVQANQVGQVASKTGTATTAALNGGLTIAVGTAAAVTVGASSNYATSSPGQTADSAYAKAADINAAIINNFFIPISPLWRSPEQSPIIVRFLIVRNKHGAF